jgi:lipooligosaccharide transport system ATP-binding protein
MIACVSPRTGGDLSILGLDPELDGVRIRGRLGVVPQQDNLDLDLELSVRENLIVYGRYFGISRAECRRRAQELLEFAQLGDKADIKVDALSGGMKRRLTVARSLINDPELLLLDEPTTGLDPQARHVLWDRLFRLKHQGVTLVLTTHYMDEAEQLCDCLVVLDGGRIVSEGSPTELIGAHSSREVSSCASFPAHSRRPNRWWSIWSNGWRSCPTGCCSTPMTARPRWKTCTPGACDRGPRWSGGRPWKTSSSG